MSVITVDPASRPARRPRAPIAPALRARLRLPTGLLLERAWYDLRKPLFASRAYSLLLPTRLPAGPSPTPLADTWPGNAAQGAAIGEGVCSFGGQTIHDPAPLWAPVGARPAWIEALQSFEWLRDLRAAGGESSRRVGREFIGRWIDEHRNWDALAWRPDLIGRRLTAWLSHYEFLGIAGDTTFRGRFLLSVARQAHHLARALPGGLSGSPLLAAIAGLLHAGLAVPRGGPLIGQGQRLLAREIMRQILPDGGHRERSPAVQLEVLRLFTGLRASFLAAGAAPPPALDEAIAGLAQVLRLFQHGDGSLALFNDSNEEEDWLVDMALARANPTHAGTKGLVLKEAPDSGFQRLVANRTLVLVDGGAPPVPGFDRHTHAGTLAFEMSIGRERLIVNCGAHAGHGGDWWAAQRSTAAHSTVTVKASNSSILAPDGGLVRGPRTVVCRREEAEGNVWLEMSHDGYAANLDVVHRRRLFLSAAGDDLRGEDRLVGGGRHPFDIRFHLHPGVTVSMAQNGQAALLRLASGTGWRLRATGAPVTLEESVYLGRRGETRKSQQIVIAGEKGADEAVVKWAIAREGKPGKTR